MVLLEIFRNWYRTGAVQYWVIRPKPVRLYAATIYICTPVQITKVEVPEIKMISDYEKTYARRFWTRSSVTYPCVGVFG